MWFHLINIFLYRRLFSDFTIFFILHFLTFFHQVSSKLFFRLLFIFHSIVINALAEFSYPFFFITWVRSMILEVRLYDIIVKLFPLPSAEFIVRQRLP